ncbi:60Kd inner membrane protein-domain-containing protein [Lipomyces japonicus]|uniref:60Kd inner membrane protein-domain-containing protein n=1 Tax=Lipomyces japonicus TaxID=56871 RepID=UPI0034CE71FD
MPIGRSTGIFSLRAICLSTNRYRAVNQLRIFNHANIQASSRAIPTSSLVFARFNSTKQPFDSTTVTTTPSPTSAEGLLVDNWDQASSGISSAIFKAASTSNVECASDHIGYLNSIGLAQTWYWPPDLIQHLAEYVHVFTDTPWWASIVICTIGIRALLLPAFILSSDHANRMLKVKPELEKLMKDFSTDKAANPTAFLLARKALLKEHNISTKWISAPMITLPISLGMFFGFNNMGNADIAGFAEQGAFWFTNLAAPDPYLILHFITATSFAAVTRIGGETGVQSLSPFFLNLLTVLPFVSVMFTVNLPASVLVYLTTTSVWAILQSLLLRTNRGRSLIGLSPLIRPDRTSPQKPFAEQWKEFLDAAKKAAEEKNANKNR